MNASKMLRWIIRRVDVVECFLYVSIVCHVTPFVIGSAGIDEFFPFGIGHEYVVGSIFHIEVNDSGMVPELPGYYVVYLNEWT